MIFYTAMYKIVAKNCKLGNHLLNYFIQLRRKCYIFKKMLCTIKFWVHLHTYKFMFSLQIAYLFLRINLVVRFASASLSSMIRRMASCQKFLRYSMGVTNNHPGRIYFGEKFQSEWLLTFVYYSRSISHFITERGEWRAT